MKKILKLFSLLLIFSLTCVLFACEDTPAEPPAHEHVDYVSNLKFDLTSSTVKAEVTVKQFIDGDTTHFNISESIDKTGVLKARYLAINTPESTGVIEEWGKKASSFTKEKLSSAVSIYVESDNEKWNLDSTGGRYLVWVWYKTSKDAEYRNLNLEILQEGLAISSNSGDNKYGSTCLSAIAQAKAEKLYVYSKEKDPDFYYGDRIDLTLKELRINIEKYSGKRVAFEAVVTKKVGETIYVEEYDPETGLYFGMQVYLGYGLPGKALQILSKGNRVLIVGSVQYYEAGDTWQVSDLRYRTAKPTDPNNVRLISENNESPYTKLDIERFLNGKEEIVVNVDGEDVNKTFSCSSLMMNTTVTVSDLTVKSYYTTNNGGNSDGALTLTCEVNGREIVVRTEVLHDQEGKLLDGEDLKGKTIQVKGIIDYFKGTHQIKVFDYEDILIQE